MGAARGCRSSTHPRRSLTPTPRVFLVSGHLVAHQHRRPSEAACTCNSHKRSAGYSFVAWLMMTQYINPPVAEVRRQLISGIYIYAMLHDYLADISFLLSSSTARLARRRLSRGDCNKPNLLRLSQFCGQATLGEHLYLESGYMYITVRNIVI